MNPIKNPQYFGKRLKQAIKNSRLTQKEISEKLLITQDTMTNYVKGTIPRADILFEIARLLNVSVDWLLTGEGPGPGEKSERDPAFAARLKEALAAVGLTPEQAAAHLNLPISKLKEWSQGELPDPKELLALARLAGVTVEWLLSGEGNSPPGRAAPQEPGFEDGLTLALEVVAKSFTEAIQDLKQLLQQSGRHNRSPRSAPRPPNDEAAAVDDQIEENLYRVLPGLSPPERDKLYRYLEYLLETRKSGKSPGSNAASVD